MAYQILISFLYDTATGDLECRAKIIRLTQEVDYCSPNSKSSGGIVVTQSVRWKIKLEYWTM